MSRWFYVLLSLLLCLPLLAACGTGEAVQSASTPDEPPAITVVGTAPATAEPATDGPSTAAPPAETATTLPTATSAAPTAAPAAPEPTLAPDTRIGSVNVGGMTQSEAIAELDAQLAANRVLPLEIQIDGEVLTYRPTQIDLAFPVKELVQEAFDKQEQTRTVSVPLRVEFDRATIREELETRAEAINTSSSLELVSTTDTLTRTFTYRPGRTLDVDAAMEQIERHLGSTQATQTLEIEIVDETPPANRRPDFEAVRQAVGALAEEWDGVVGFYLYDLETGETVELNSGTVFSGASIMKVAILLHAYISLPEFTPEQKAGIEAMIIESDNLQANDVLAATVNGTGTDAAYAGVLAMSKMLSDLGLEHSYMNMPYEAHDYLVGLRGIDIKRGPPQEGPPPFTAADPILRTTPAEISQVFIWIDECSKGQGGVLLDRFPQQLSAERCQEMLDLLTQNADLERFAAVIPESVRVEHKSGWVQDMHADAAIVRSPGGDYLLTVYVWRGVEEVPGVWANPYLRAFSHLVYTAYNPVNPDKQAEDESTQ